MMDSNSEMKIEKKMEPKLIYTRKERFNDSFFIRKPIISDVNNEQIKNCNEQASFAFSYTQPHSMKINSTQVLNLNKEPLTVNHKTASFMKKILRNHFVLVTALVIASLFLANSSNAQ